MIRVLLIPSSDYLGHPFPQRHNQIFERVHDGKDFEVHVVRFNLFNKAKLSSKCVLHEIPLEFRTESTPIYYLSNALSHVKEMLKIIKQESIDMIVAGNLLPPLLFHLVKGVSRLKLPFIFDLQDYYPTSAAGYICNVNGVLGAMVRGAFDGVTRALLRMADAVTVPGIALTMYTEKIRGKTGRKVHVIPNGVSEHFLNQHNGSLVRDKFGYKEEDLVVGYVGSIEFWLDMKTLIKAVSRAYQQGVNVRLMLIGGRLQTGYAENVRKWIKQEGLESLTNWLDFIPHEEVPRYVAAMDLGVIPFDVANLTAYYAAPNKLWEYLSQGVDVVSTPIPEALAYQGLLEIVRNEEDYLSILRKKALGKRCGERQGRKKPSPYLQNRTWTYSADKFRDIMFDLALHKN